MNWKNRVKKFLLNSNDKILFLLNLEEVSDEIASFLHNLLKQNPRQYLIVIFNASVSTSFASLNLNFKLADDYLSKDDYEYIDNYVFHKLSTSWYLYKGITDYRGIKLGEIFEYEFQKFLIPRIKNLQIITGIIEAEQIKRIVILTEKRELFEVAKLYADLINLPVLRIIFKRDGIRLLQKLILGFKKNLSGLLSKLFDYLAFKMLMRKDDRHKSLILIDARLYSYFKHCNDRIEFVPCPMEGGAGIRLGLLRQGVGYFLPYSKEKRRYLKNWVIYKKRWQELSSAKDFRDTFKYKDVSIWAVVCSVLNHFFSERIPMIISNIETIQELLHRKKIRAIVLRNDVKAQERILVFAARFADARSLVIQHGVLAERNGHSSLFADKFVAWGQASIDWYSRKGDSLDKFTITGNLRFDGLAHWRPRLSREALCGQLKFNKDKGIFLFVTQQINKFSSYWIDDLFLIMLQRILETMQEFPDKQLIIKVDPYEDLRPYKYLILTSMHNNAIAAIRDFDIYTLIFHSELVIAHDSTVALEAMVFDKPVISFNLTKRKDRVPYAEKGAALSVANEIDLSLAIRRVLSDEEVISNLKVGRSRFVKEYAYRIDGKSTERILDLVKRYVGQ